MSRHRLTPPPPAVLFVLPAVFAAVFLAPAAAGADEIVRTLSK